MQTYIDFDGTLFDTDKYVDDFMNIFSEYGITKVEFEEAKKILFHNDELFNIIKITNYLMKKYNVSDELKEKILALLDKSYLYPEVLDCLDVLISSGYELNILTYGDKEFQKMKVQSTNLSKYLKEIIITDEDKSKLNLDYKHSIFIDNSPIEVEKFYEAGAKKIIRIRRSIDKYSKIDSNILGLIECEDFNQVVELMKGEF